jgi:O-antigen ligase
VPASAVHPVVRWALYLFAASLPFEYPEHTIPLEVHTITGFLFVGATFLQPRVTFGRWFWAVGGFALYLYIYVVAFALNGGAYHREVARLFILLTQLTLLLWAAANLMRFASIARATLGALAWACIARALLQLARVATSGHAVFTGGQRVTALGQNANVIAWILAAGLVALLGLAYGRHGTRPRYRGLIWAAVVLFALVIAETGSRGGLLALAAGVVTFLAGGRGIRGRARNAVAALAALGVLYWAATSSDVMRNRITATLETGNLAGRERIVPTLWSMFLERPTIGWGPINNKYELASRIPFQHRAKRDTHNIVLEVLTATGVVGAIPFFGALGLCARAAWRARRGRDGILPLALLAVGLVANMSGNWIAAPLFWLIMAYPLASADPLPEEQRPPPPDPATARVGALRARSSRVASALTPH